MASYAASYFLHFRKVFLIILLIGILFPLWSYADVIDCSGSDPRVVKASCEQDLFYDDEDDTGNPNPCFTLLNATFTTIGFTPAAPAANIWPGIADSDVHTAEPFTYMGTSSLLTLVSEVLATGELVDLPLYEIAIYEFTTHSLKDLGTYQVLVQLSGYTIHGENAACYLPEGSPPTFQYHSDFGPGVGEDDFQLIPVYVEGIEYFEVYNYIDVNPSVSGTMNVGNLLSLDANADDPDGGSIPHYEWSVITQPAGSTSSLSSTSIAAPTLNLVDHYDIGNWELAVQVADDEGELIEGYVDFIVDNRPPTVTISGTTPVQMFDEVILQADPAVDADGESIDWLWYIDSMPPTANLPPGIDGNTNKSISFFTQPGNQGAWTFRCVASDGHYGSAEDTFTVVVEVIEPQIDIVASAETIPEGVPIQFQTTILNDGYGDPMASFQWEIIQVPNAAAPLLGPYGGNSSSIVIPNANPGTWIVKLTVTDQVGSTNEATASILVDAVPVAVISGDVFIGDIIDPLSLSGQASYDLDSPEGVANYGHLSVGAVEGISLPEIAQYRWNIIELPAEYYGEYFPGPVADVLEINGNSSVLNVPAGRLKPGEWLFELEVVDSELNSNSAYHLVTVVEQGTPPVAIVIPSPVYTVDVNGLLSENVIVDGSNSYDLDNLLSGNSITAGLNYNWQYISVPNSCLNPPSLPTAPLALLYSAGTQVSGPCQGTYNIALTVTDDEGQQSYAATQVIIGNCPEDLCIDSPTLADQAVIKFSNKTDVVIKYHMNSVLYDDPRFEHGMRVNMQIYHHSDSITPVYDKSWDLDILPSDKGGGLALHWYGFDNSNQRPESGKYTVKLQLFQISGAASGISAVEADSILIQVMDINVTPATDEYVNRDELVAATDSIHVDYQVTGQNPGEVGFDALRFRVRDTVTSALVHDFTYTAPFLGSFDWNGDLGGGTFIPTGTYEIELEILEGVNSLDVSDPYSLHVFRVDIDVDADRDGAVDDTVDEPGEDTWIKSRGAIFAVNLDREGVRTDAGTPIPDALHLNDAGMPTAEDHVIDNAADQTDITPFIIRGLGIGLPPGLQVFLMAAELEDIQSVHIYKQIAAGETAIWGSLGDRVGGAAEPLEIDITSWVDPASATFLGAAPDDDLVFGLEGLLFRFQPTALMPGLQFDGEIDLTLEVRDGATVVSKDNVRIKVAPWIMLPHTLTSTEVWAVDDGAINEAFLENAKAEAGYFGLDNSTQLQTVSGADAGSQWFQDHIEIGYYERPGGPKTHGVLRLPYGTLQPRWPLTRLLSPNVGAFQIAADLGGGAGDFGGNVELLPPTAGHPLGRIIIGDTRSASLWEFLVSQEVQAPVELPAQWLSVSHVDEVIGFTPTVNEVVVTSPSLAYAILDGIPPADRGRSVLFATGGLPQAGVAAADATTSTRLETGIDHTGQAWKYVRIYRDSGSGAAGQVAHISTLGVGFIEIDQVWDVPQKLVPGGGAPDYLMNHLFTAAPGSLTWFVNPAAGDDYVLVEGTRFWYDDPSGGDGTPAIITVEEVLADADLRNLNLTDAQGKIMTMRGLLETAAGGAGNITWVEVPTIYLGNLTGFDTGRSAYAFTPGQSNYQLVNGESYFPRQYGPRDIATGNDLFEEVVTAVVPAALFVDNWNLYHRLEGEVHCGSNVKRTPYAFDWWENQP